MIQLRLPPLRERAEDLAALVLEFAKRHANLHEAIMSLDPELVEELNTCKFEGNVRELENAMQRMLFHKGEGNSLSRADWLRQQLPSGGEGNRDDSVTQATNLLWMEMSKHGISFRELIRRIESELLRKALRMEGKTHREIAGMLRTSERTLYHKISSQRGTGGERGAA